MNEDLLLFDIQFNNQTLEEMAVDIFNSMKGCSENKQPEYVATINVDFLVNTFGWSPFSIKNQELFNAFKNAKWVSADGMPIVWFSHLLGMPLKERVTGADLLPRMAEKMASLGKRMYLLGGRKGVAQKAANRLSQNYPGLEIAGTDSSIISVENDDAENKSEEDADIISRINASKADVLLLGLGNPKQEIWFYRNRHRLNVRIAIGVGGAFDFVAGNISRAPRWIQASGMEWIFRIIQEPRRLWKRYFIGIFKFVAIVTPVFVNHYVNYHNFKFLQPTRKI